MATQQNINIGVKVDDGGSSAKTTKNVEKLHGVLKQTQETAAKINVGGTAGSRGVAAAARPSGSQAAAAPTGSQAMMSGEEYGRLRGSAGVTGASARDFANQAQGLGGLVRLYATYAANIFAVSAAFTALKNAADTTNLVRGLDTLGAASGRALGTLSKQLVAATDGAVSLREAMAATATASSAGMSSENIKRLAVVAKSASLALGVSMPDALNRLSRGIVKLEPELLDELGLFTKIGPATEKYALELGKTASQLTDFERRQAFANAVLDEGEKKFSALAEASANPYDKFLANLKNVAQTGLEVINTVLLPIVDILSRNPVALGAGLLGIGSILLRQALPALGEFKRGLQLTAERDAAAAKNRAGDAVAARQQLNKLIEAKVEAAADFELKKFEQLEAKLTAAREAGIRKRGSLYKVLAKDLVDIEESDIKAAEQSVSKFEKRASTDPQLKQQAELERATLNQLKATIAAEEQLTTVKLANRDLVTQQLEKSGVLARVTRESLAYEAKAQKSALVSNAAYNSSLLGIRNSWKLFTLEVEAAGLKLNAIERGFLLARGAAASLTGVVTLLGSALNKALGIFGLVATAYAIFDGLASNNTKQMQKFDSAVDAAAESSENATRTLLALQDASGVEKSTIESTMALSNALTEIADSARQATVNSKLAKEAMNWYDSFWNGLASVVNLDIDSKLGKALAEQVRSAIELLARENLNPEFESAVKEALGVTKLSEIAGAFEDASDEVRARVVKLLQDVKGSLGKVASELQTFKESSDNALNSYKQFLQSTADSNPLFKLGRDLVQLSIDMDTFANSTGSVIKAFDNLAQNPAKAALFGQGFIEQFAQIRTEFEKQKTTVDTYNSAILKLEKNLGDLTEQQQSADVTQLANLGARRTPFIGSSESQRRQNQQLEDSSRISTGAQADIRQVQNQLDILRKQRSELPRDAIEAGSKLFSQGLEQALKRGLEFAQRGLRQAVQESERTVAKASAEILTGSRRIEADAQIRRQELKQQLELIDSNINLINAQEALVKELALANALARQKNDPDNPDLAREVNFATLSAQIAQGVVVDLKNLQVDITPQQGQRLAAQQNIEAIRNIEQRAARVKIEGEKKALEITTGVGIERAKLQDETELVNLTAQANKLYTDRQNILSSIAGVTSLEIIKQQSARELGDLENKQLQENKKLELDIRLARAGAARARAEAIEKQEDPEKSEVVARYKEEIAFLQKKLGIQKQIQYGERNVQGLVERQKLLQKELDQIGKTFELQRARRELNNTLDSVAIEYQQQLFDLDKERLGLANEIVVSRQTDLQIQQLSLQNSFAIAQAQDALNQKQKEAEARKASLTLQGIPETDSQFTEIDDEFARQQTLTEYTISGLKAQYETKVAIAEKTREINLEQERYNQLLESANINSENLATVFKRFGETLGTLVVSMQEIAISSEKRAKSEKTLQDKLTDAQQTRSAFILQTGEDSEELYNKQKQAEKDLGAQQEKNDKEKIADDAKLLKSAKGLFKEKTFAFKALGALEKANALASLALNAQSMAATLMSIPGKIAGGVAELFKQGGFLGFAGAAAFLAIMAGLGFGGGGGGGGFVPTAEQAQEVQGTGMAFDRFGNKVETGRGVFGDAEAKNTGIERSLEIISENSVAGLSYDNKALRALEGIRDAVGNLAISLFKVPGLRTGSAFGTAEGTSGFGGILGFFGNQRTTSIQNSGVLISGAVSDLAQGIDESALQFFEDVTVSKKNMLGKSKTWNQRNLKPVTDDVNEFFASVFGNARIFLQDVGKELGFTASQVSQTIDPLKIRAELSTRGLKGEELQKEVSAVVGDLLDQMALAVFPELERFQEFGETYTATVTRVTDTNKKVLQQLKNTTGRDLEQSLNLTGVVPKFKQAVTFSLASIAEVDENELRAKLAPLGGKFVSALDNSIATGIRDTSTAEGFGREFFEYLNPQLLQQQFAQFNQADLEKLKKAGVDFVDRTTTTIADGITTSFDAKDIRFVSIEITDALVKLFGGVEEGLDKFVEQTNFFIDNFLTEAEKLAPTQRSVTEELARITNNLGLSSAAVIDTREEFKNLVQGLDLTTETGRIAYRDLMNVAEGFDAVTTAAEQLASKTKDLQTRILELQAEISGDPGALRAVQRAGVLEATDPALRATQQYVFALEDVRDASKELEAAKDREGQSTKAAIDRLKSSIGVMRSFGDGVRKFIDSLLLSANSILTPGEKYTEARRQFDALLATANAPATTPEEISARDAALQQLTGAGSSVLEAARVFYASSDEYTDIFNYIQRALTSTASQIEQQIPIEERQLSELEKLNGGVITVAEAIERLAVAQARAAGLAAPAYSEQARNTGRAVIAEGIVYGSQGDSSATQTFARDVTSWMNSAAQTYLNENRDVADAYAANNYRLSLTEFVNAHYLKFGKDEQRGATTMQMITQLYDNLVNNWKLSSMQVAQMLGMSQADVLSYFGTAGLPAFARGTNFVPQDMVAQIHQGERIIPAADNAQLMQSINNRNETNRVLVEEIKNLRREVQQLREQQAQETGKIIVANFDAQVQNAQLVGEAVVSTAQNANQAALARENAKKLK